MKRYKTKVSKEQSIQIQKLIFKLGGEFVNGSVKVNCEAYPYIFVGSREILGISNIYISYSSYEHYFEKSKNKFVGAEALIKKLEKKVKKYTFKKFLKDRNVKMDFNLSKQWQRIKKENKWDDSKYRNKWEALQS